MDVVCINKGNNMNRELQIAGNKRMLAFYEATHSSNSLIEAVIKRQVFQTRLKEIFDAKVSKKTGNAHAIRLQDST